MRRWLPFDWDILKFIVSDLSCLSNIDYIITFDWDVVSDVLDLKVVCVHFLDRHSLPLLQIINVLLFIGDHLHSALGRWRIGRVNMNPLAPSRTYMTSCCTILFLHSQLLSSSYLLPRLLRYDLSPFMEILLMLPWRLRMKVSYLLVSLELFNLHFNLWLSSDLLSLYELLL